MSSPVFTPATKTQARLRLALIGVSGSGKTYSALAIATALGKRVAVIDSEHGSASKYAGDPFVFDTLALSSYHPSRYIDAIRAAETAGYDVVIIDSLSHVWVGKDGELDLKDRASSRQGENSFTAWRHVTPLHNELVDSIIGARCHVIATMRAKTEYVLEERGGKQVPRKVGIGPVMRDGVEYEFDVAADMNLDHEMVVSKTRCPALDGAVILKPGAEVAETLAAWLSDGTPPPPPAAKKTVDEIEGLIAELFAGNGKEQVARQKMLADYGTTVTAHLSKDHAAELLARLRVAKQEIPA